MKVVIQRSKKSSVSVSEKLINKIDKGLCILVGITPEDTDEDINYLVKKIVNLRIFDDEEGVMNKSILNSGGEILLISQFTLMADTSKGNRPSYIGAAKGDVAEPLYEKMLNTLNNHVKTYGGVFGAEMLVNIENDGPITIIIDSKNK